LNSPATGRDRYDIIRDISAPMKYFHWKVADDLLESNDDKIRYFRRLYEYSIQIQPTILSTNRVTKLALTYDTDNKICGVINTNKTVAIFGSYSYKGGIDLGGSKIITKNAVDCIKDLFGEIIRKNNIDTSFDFNTWLS
jgi:hypothetical protein